MILNRRTFLKALGAIGLIPALPSIEFTQNNSTDVENSYLNEPITIINPLAHLVINGMEIPVMGISIDAHADYELNDYDTAVRTYKLRYRYYTISFRTDFDTYQKVTALNNEKLNFIVRPKYSHYTLSGEAYITSESVSMSPGDCIYCDIEIQSSGIVEVRNENETKYISQ